MPTLSIFYGIVVQVYWFDHAPPHFHARYAEHEAQIEIMSASVLNGSLPKRALAMVLEWTREHQAELMAAWEAASAGATPVKIAPLP
ncbi:DUF4160 domain-containing protein [Sphingomonas lenta]|uniref:Transcriptional regulator n=1 Tax=Sphingomonas lenta TaxID=1141887 RepID=A0A2A2SHV2_9SPHN|nr:DUF4160 domain-containing protein [Sphingomonas lenta]PAX08798.1 transcriptional regulator [Sphingomonas lenta]